MAATPDERNMVELPLVEQLKRMGWQYFEGSVDVPTFTERDSFREVLLTQRLRTALLDINLDDNGFPWLDHERATQAISALSRLGAVKLMDANECATGLLLSGVAVEGDPARLGGRNQLVRFIDFEHVERNDFLVINQFRVDIPGGQSYIVPDLVLFVNGIPLVVIECKSPAATDPIEEAITQLLRYSNQRGGVAANEGVERLFHYNQVMIATDYYRACAGTVGAEYSEYLAWKDTSPLPMSEVAAELGVTTVNGQQTLVAGILRPAHLLSLIRNFTLFQHSSAKTTKMMARYQQFRAVYAAVDRLTHGQTREQHGVTDQRGGVVWHTQGSGKSLTMVFLVRMLRSSPVLRRFKVVVITDRKDLEQQLSETATLAGETVYTATTSADVQRILSAHGPDLVFAMIQKYQQHDDAESTVSATNDQDFPLLNEDASILVLVDEAHRSQTSQLHSNLLHALPNCARIGFTGTPIMIGDRKYTRDIFGEFLDRYTLQQSEVDGATVPILYEGRTTRTVVSDGRDIDQLFEDMFRDHTPEEHEALRRRYATVGAVLEAPRLIAAKAENMLKHYVDTILPNGFKAQVVAASRLAAVRYQAAFVEAHRRLIADLEALPASLLALSADALALYPPETQFFVRAHAHRETIRRLEFAAIISGAHNDDATWRVWSERSKVESYVQRFKKPLVDEDVERQDGLAFLCVKSMLLTGFDAHIEQALYLDRFMKGHELLQAIARVNRTASNKSHGLVVDYFGVGHHLKEALDVYAADDVHGALVNIADELPKLADRHRRSVAVFHDRGIPDIHDVDACVDLLRDQRVRAEFVVKLKQFAETLDMVMPRPEALPYLRDAKLLGFINKAAANLYRDPQLNLLGAGQKVRQLIDDYIEAQGIDPRVPPISILDANFEQAVNAHRSPRAKASEMEHAARYYLRVHMPEDPAYYQRLSERLEAILQTFRENWDELVAALAAFTTEVRAGRPQDASGLDPRTQSPFLGLLLEAQGGRPTAERGQELVSVTIALVDQIRQEIRVVDFWRNQNAQNTLRGWLIRYLDDHDIAPFNRLTAIADQLIDLARVLHTRLVGEGYE